MPIVLASRPAQTLTSSRSPDAARSSPVGLFVGAPALLGPGPILRRPFKPLPTPAPLSLPVLKPRTPKQHTFKILLARSTPPSPAPGSEHDPHNQRSKQHKPNVLLDVQGVTCSADLGTVREATAFDSVASELLASDAKDSEERVRPFRDQLEHPFSAMLASGLRIV